MLEHLLHSPHFYDKPQALTATTCTSLSILESALNSKEERQSSSNTTQLFGKLLFMFGKLKSKLEEDDRICAFWKRNQKMFIDL